MAPDDAALRAFFLEGQELQEAGDDEGAALVYRHLIGTDSGGGEEHDIVLSMAHNGLAEICIDNAMVSGFPLCWTDGTEAHLREALAHLARATACFAGNSTTTMSEALLRRDLGQSTEAVACWLRAAALPPAPRARAASGSDEEGDTWRQDWELGPQERCAPLAAMHGALLLSQLGRHADAAPLLRRMGFRWRLAPAVWACAAMRRAGPRDADSSPVRVFPEAVGPGTYELLRSAFAPSASYWRETAYESAAGDKSYFTWYVDLRGGAPAAGNAVERLIARLAPLTGCDDLVSCEWWVHQRAAGRGAGHELHFDVEEATMESTGRTVHPAVSSVVYVEIAPYIVYRRG
jgi:hypothetical protein